MEPFADQQQAQPNDPPAQQFTAGRRDLGTSRYGYQDPSTLASGLALTQLVPDITDGDLGRDAIALAHAMTGYGARCEILASPGPNTGANLLTRLPEMGIHFQPLPLQKKGFAAQSKNKRLLERHARLFQPTVIHAHSRAPAWVGKRVADRLGIPFVTTFHGLYNYRSGFKRNYNAIMARGSRVIAPSQFVRSHIEEHYPEATGRIRVIPRGIDLVAYNRQRFHQGDVQSVRDAYGLLPGRPVLICAGRLSFWKGQHLFLELIKRLSDLNPHGLIFSRTNGKREYRAQLDEKIKRWKLGDSAQIVTQPVDMRAIYLAADAVVSTAVEPEAFIHSVAEAMVLGQPVIAPDHGAGPEQVTHHETGWLYRPGSLDALEHSVREALALNEDQRMNLGQWAMEDAVAAYDQQTAMLQTLDCYREAMREG